MKHYLICVFCGLILFGIFFTFTAGELTAQIIWEKYEGNPVLVPGAPGEWDDYSLFPISILFDGSIYHMWYGGHDGTYPRIGYATSPDGITWTKYAGNPVLDIGESGSWEDDRVQSPYVLFDGNTYHMWYIGQNSGIGYNRIGYATSTDRVTWTKYEGNPVLDVSPEGTWEIRGYDAPCILFDGSTYHMWYHAWVPDLYLICYATSPDGITWTKYAGNPVLDIGSNGSWDSHKVLAPEVFFDGTTYHMWYTGNATDWEDCIGYATSADGINWTKFTGNPVLKMSKAGEWDSKYICRCRVLKDTATSTYKMWYGGGVIDYQAVSFGYATSPDILDVPGDFETIQVAIDAASDGNIVLVDEGTYYENINFRGKAITVASHFLMDGDTNHINNTIIDGSLPSNPDSSSVVYFVSGEDTTSILCGFTITGGTGTKEVDQWGTFFKGGGVYMNLSGGKIKSNKIRNNHIQTNTNWETWGGGIYVNGDDGDFVTIKENWITQNTVTASTYIAWAGGVWLQTKEHIQFRNNQVINNIVNGGRIGNGGGLFLSGGDWGFGMLDGTIDISENLIQGNIVYQGYYTGQFRQGGGGVCIHLCSPDLKNNIIANNEVIAGGAMSAFGGGIQISDNPGSHGLTFPVIINNTICGNIADIGGGIFVTNNINPDEVHPILINTIVWGNIVNDISPGISADSISIVYCNIEDGWEGQGNIDADPEFADTLYHLSESSLCIGSGIDSVEIAGVWYYCPDNCFFGNPRPDPPGTNPDIGACESPRGSPEVGLEREVSNNLPKSYDLHQNYPNPFNPTTTIEFEIPKTSDVTLKIFNILGAEVSTLVSDRLTAGSYSYEWDASNLATGVYLYRLSVGSLSGEAGDFVETRKMVLMR